MPRGSKPGERRGGRQKGTPNKKTVLRDTLFCATASNPNASPLDFMLALMRDPKVPVDLRLDIAVAAAPFVHAKPRAPSRVRTDPMHCGPIHSSSQNSSHEFAAPKMETELRPSKSEDENRGGKDGGGEEGRVQQVACHEGGRRGLAPEDGGAVVGSQAGVNGVSQAGERASAENQLGEDGVAGHGLGGDWLGGDGLGGDGLGGDGVGDRGVELSPLEFLLDVMKDPAVTPRQRIRAARVAARYQHTPVVPDKIPAVDEYGFAISRTLAIAIKDDWLALGGLEVASKDAEKRAEIRARQAQRDELLQCPPGYSPDRDVERREELLKKHRSKAEETELAYVIARITASEAVFYRTPEGRIHRRLEDLEYRREAANREKNRRVGLTRAEGKELDELRKKYPRRDFPLEFLGELARAGLRDVLRAAARPAARPESEMEELTSDPLELLARFKAQK